VKQVRMNGFSLFPFFTCLLIIEYYLVCYFHKTIAVWQAR